MARPDNLGIIVCERHCSRIQHSTKHARNTYSCTAEEFDLGYIRATDVLQSSTHGDDVVSFISLCFARCLKYLHLAVQVPLEHLR